MVYSDFPVNADKQAERRTCSIRSYKTSCSKILGRRDLISAIPFHMCGNES